MKFRREEATFTQRMLVLAIVLLSPQWMFAESPREVLERYCKMDANGKQLEVGGWLQLARMFIVQRELSPGPIVVFRHKLEVIRGFLIGDPVMEGDDKAKLAVRYSYFGEIDYDSLIFSPSKEPSVEEVRTYNLLLTTKHYDLGSQSEEVLRSGAKAWRIEGSPSEPHLKIDAALFCVQQLRDKATGAITKENANVTIKALSRLRLSLPRDPR